MRLFPSPSPPPSPPLLRLDGPGVAAIGAGLVICTAVAATPQGEQLVQRLGGWKSASVLALLLNIAAVGVGGRFDGDPAVLQAPPWPTLLNPAGWAFAIWGAIYSGEIAAGLYMALSDNIPPQSAGVAAAWVAANGAQSLWCAAFRPWALDRLWLSAGCLGATASFLALAQHRALALAARPPLLVLVPRSLHLGWVTAAALVNVNAWIGYSQLGPAAALAAAVLSLVGATLLGAAYTAALRLPAATLAVGWALLALASGAPLGADADALGPQVLKGIAISERACGLLLVAIALPRL